MATAARRSANLTTLYTTAKESWYSADKAEDIIFKANPALWIMSQTVKEVGSWGFDHLVRILESKNESVGSFAGYDPLPISTPRGPQAARFSMSNYAASIQMSWEEQIENKEPNRLADLLQFRIEQAELSLADRMTRDLYKGNIANATDMYGLEQLLYATTDLETLGAHTGAFAYRQHTNAWGNITRSAWSTDLTGGTGWEALVADFDEDAANDFKYDSAGVPDIGLRELLDIYNFQSQGTIHPDLYLMSNSPFRDYENAAANKMQIQKESSKFGDVELGFDNLKYKNAMIIRDENAVTQNATGTAGNNLLGEQNVYGLNTRFLRLLVEEGADFEFTDEVPAQNQLAGVFFIVWRGQFICVNPRYQSRIYSYDT